MPTLDQLERKTKVVRFQPSQDIAPSSLESIDSELSKPKQTHSLDQLLARPEKKEPLLPRAPFVTTPRDIRPPIKAPAGTPMELRAAPEPTGFLKKAFGFEWLAKPPGWEYASPIEKFNYATIPISDFLGRIGAKITQELGITKPEQKQQVLEGIYADDLQWYQKSPEVIGWGVEKIAEYKTLSGLFKLTGLHNVLTWTGRKLAQPFIATELATPAGQQAIKTLSREGLKNLARNTLRSLLSAAPENIAFVSSWSAADALRQGKSLPEIQESAKRGALWGGAFTAAGAAIGNVAATPEIKSAGRRALMAIMQKYPRMVDALARDIEPEFVEAARQYVSQRTGADVRLVEFTARQEAALRNMARVVKAELQKQATKEAQVKAYYQAAAKAKPPVTAIEKVAGVPPTGPPPEGPTVPVPPSEIKAPAKPAEVPPTIPTPPTEIAVIKKISDKIDFAYKIDDLDEAHRIVKEELEPLPSSPEKRDLLSSVTGLFRHWEISWPAEAPPREALPRGLFSQPLFDALSGKQLQLGLEVTQEQLGAAREIPIKAELQREVSNLLARPEIKASRPDNLLPELMTRDDLFNNPRSKLPEIRTAWNNAVLGGQLFGEPAAEPEQIEGIDYNKRKELTSTRQAIQSNELYQMFEKTSPTANQLIGRRVYVDPKYKAEIIQVTGEPFQKGFNRKLWNHFSFTDRTLTDWSKAAQEAGIEIYDPSEYASLIKELLDVKTGYLGVNRKALDKAIDQDPELNLLAMKLEMLKRGYNSEEINSELAETGKEFGLDQESIKRYYVKPEAKYVRKVEKIRREVAQAPPSVEAPRVTEAAPAKEAPIKAAIPGPPPSRKIASVSPIKAETTTPDFIQIPPTTSDTATEGESPGIKIVEPKKDIGLLQKWILTLTNQARNSGNPKIIEAANTMADTGMVMQNQIRASLEVDFKLYKQLPRKYTADNGRLFFNLMDKFYSPEMIDKAPGFEIPPEVKPVLRHFKLQEEAMRQEIIKHKRELATAIYQRKGLTELQRLAADKNIPVTKQGVTKAVNRTKAELAAELAYADIPDNWGRQWSHIPHIFFGRYQLQFRDLEGKTHFIGTAETQAEAFQKLADWKEARKAAGFDDADKIQLIATPETHIPLDMMRISRRHFYWLEGQLKDAADLNRQEVDDALRGIIGKRESKQKWWGSLVRRKGAPGYSLDFPRVWRVQTVQFNRWKYLTEMNRKIEPLIEQVRAEGLRGWAEQLEHTKDFLWGRKRSTIARNIDEHLSRIPLIKNYVKPYALERWFGMVKSVNYWRHLQTGRFYLINSLQPLQTLWPVVGEKGMYRAVKLYYSSEGQELLRKHNVGGITGKLHEIGMARGRRFERFLPAGASEIRNHCMAFLALYDHGIKTGMSDADAARYARLRGQLLTQFTYTPADIPRAMQGPVGGLIFQYKRFGIKNLELISRLAREGNWSGVGRWLAALLGIGGLNVFLKTISVGGLGYLTYKMYKEIEKRYGKDTADVVHHGLPGLVGIDLSGSVTPIDVPYGRNVYEKTGNIMFGPTGQTIVRLIADLVRPDVAKEIGLVPRGWKSIVDSSPAIKQFVSLVKALEKDTSDYDAKQRRQYELEVWDLWKKAFGFRPETESIQRMQYEAMLSLKREYDNTLNKITLECLNRKPYRAAQIAIDWNGKYPEAPITSKAIWERAKAKLTARQLTMVKRGLLQLPTPLRPRFLDDMLEETRTARD